MIPHILWKRPRANHKNPESIKWKRYYVFRADAHDESSRMISSVRQCVQRRPESARSSWSSIPRARRFDQPLTATARAFSRSRKITYVVAQRIVTATKIIPMTFTAGVRPKRIRDPISVTRVWDAPMEKIVVL